MIGLALAALNGYSNGMINRLGPFAAALLSLTCTSFPLHADRLVLVAGGGQQDPPCAATEVRLKEPFAAELDPAGRLVIAEMAQGQRVLRLEADGKITRLAGTGAKGSGGDGGPALQAQFDGIHNFAIAATGDIYFADTWNCRIRKLDAKTGILTSVAGTGEKGFAGDGGPATAAKLGGIYCATLDFKNERLYLADLHNNRIRYLDLKTGLIQPFAGNGQKGVPKNGAKAAESPLSDPRAVAPDRLGNVYILERGGNALRVVRPDGTIHTVVNASGKNGAEGDGGPALAATMNGPKHLCVDRDDNVIIADAENHLIRKFLPREGKIVRVAGTGKVGKAGLGSDPLQAGLSRPHGVFATADGTLYITDSYNNRVLKIVR